MRKKLEDKMARIDEMQRKREHDREERRVKSKSPSNNNVTTMSEFECTPYNQSKMFDRNAGFNTL
jgi:hypothetical protein